MKRMVNLEQVNPDWHEFFDNSTMSLLDWIEDEIGVDYTPSKEKILRFAHLPLMEQKVIILGQDPYPARGVATGRAFEVEGLGNWNQKFRQSSLKNILRLLYRSYTGDVLKYKEILKKINSGYFDVLQPDKLFKHWESQGVLLLNTYLTCKLGAPKSHRKIWALFANKLITYIDCKHNDLVWFLWGAEAQQYQTLINNGTIICSNHPMICNLSNPDDFLNSKCFERTSNISWIG